MDITSLYYFSELAKTCHMTNTAKKLFISQQTLSNQIARLEQQLGCKLFYRKPSLSLTYSGEQVLIFANSVLSEYANLKDVLIDIQEEKTGLIRFGAPAMRSNLCIPAIMPAFSQNYPNVEIRLFNGISRELIPMIQNGSLDLGIIVGEAILPDLIYIPMLRDQIFLCIPKMFIQDLQKHHSEIEASEMITENDLRYFKDIPFYIFDNQLGNTIQQYLDIAGLRPKILLTSPSTRVITKLGLQGKAAFFSTQMILSDYIDQIPDDLYIYPVIFREEPIYQQVYLVRHHKRYLPHYGSVFIDLLIKYFNSVAQTKLPSKQYKMRQQ